MSDRSTHLRLNLLEAEHILHWFYFQEKGEREKGEATTIILEEVKLVRLIRACVKRMRADQGNLAMRLSPRHCYLVFKWYGNIPDCVSDEIDADIHLALGNFLSECDDEEFC